MTTLQKIKKENEKLKEEIKRLRKDPYCDSNDGQKTSIQDLLDEMKRQGRSSISFDFISLQECFGGGNSYWFSKSKIEEEKDKTISVSDWLDRIGQGCKDCYEEGRWTDHITIKGK
jgi:hypothetical protein